MFRDPFDPFGGWGRPARDPRVQPRREAPPVDAWGRPIRRAPAPPAEPIRRAWPDPRLARDPSTAAHFDDRRRAADPYGDDELRGPRADRYDPRQPARRSLFDAPPRPPAVAPPRRAAPAEPPGALPHPEHDEHARSETEGHPSEERPSAPAARPEPVPGKGGNPAEVALRRATEELEAQRRRMEREQQRTLEETRAQVAAEMLPVLDNLDRSIAAAGNAPEAGDAAALLEGIRLVRSQFEDALGRVGLTRIETEGQRFDPAVHDAIGLVDVDDEARDGVVVDEWQRGYRLGERVIRPAKVRVGKRAAQS